VTACRPLHGAQTVITVHLIFNAHIDPVWLWPWQSGLDSVLATCRSACDLLDEQADLHFTQGEAWTYLQIERTDRRLFERIRRHVEAGRWHLVGGWWIQPDCNGPSGLGLRRQIELGREYFLERFGVFPRVGYNIDSFGHAACLPELLRSFGQDRYVFMRPQEHEMALPGRVFRWRGRTDGPEIVTFRIARAYSTRELTVEHIRASTEQLPEGIEHTMCFAGVGDHGGGITRRQIDWCREHHDRIDGLKIMFSSPDRFFEAISDRIANLPLVTGELQMHSVGCYSVQRAVKLSVRQAEHRLDQAEIVGHLDPDPEPDMGYRLREAWRNVCFTHFHDTYCGTCIPSAYSQIQSQLGLSHAVADEIIQYGIRRLANRLPEDAMQRIVLLNASDEPFGGYMEYELSVEDRQWEDHWQLLDEDGSVIAHQLMDVEAVVSQEWLYFRRLLFRVGIAPHAVKTLRVDRRVRSACDVEHPPHLQPAWRTRIATNAGFAVDLRGTGRMFLGEAGEYPLPKLELIDDHTDTWSHETDRYGLIPAARPRLRAAKLIDQGPLMASLRQRGRVGSSRIESEYRVYAGERFIELLLRIYWSEQHKVLKLTLPLAELMVRRQDGIPVGGVDRLPDGTERPVRDWTLITLASGRRLGLVFPEIYALDAWPDALRLTLLRSPLMAHHYPHPGDAPRGVFADQGLHEFRIRFLAGNDVSAGDLEAQALMMHRPPIAADITLGMPPT